MAVSNVELRVGATQAITALKNVNTQAQKFNNTVNGTNSKLKDANKALPILQKGFFGAGAGAKVAAVGFKTAGAALATALGPLTAGLTLVAALGKTFTNLAAQDFASAKVKTLGVDVDTLNPKLASLSNQLSGQVSQLDLLSASYDVASAGFGEVAELSDVLKASQLGATGGFSELATVADATTSVLNAYGLSSDQAAKLVDGFIQTQNDGKIVVDQYAQQIGRLAPIAAGAGVGIDELNAAISTVTATGVPVESTFAGLRQVIAAIQKPTSEAAKAAKELGIDFSATALSTKGLGGVLEELVAKGGASEETLAKFFGSVEARTAILPLLNDQLVSFNKNLENQANAQGTAAEAAFTASNTIEGQLTRLGTAFTNLTTDGSEFGVIIRETLKIAAVTVEALSTAVKLLFIPIRTVISAVNEVGKAIAEAIGVDATSFVFDLEQSWIGVKEGVTQFSNSVVNVGKTVGTVVGRIIKAVISTFQQIVDFVNGNRILKFIFGLTPISKFKFKIDQKDIEELQKNVEKTGEATNNIRKINVENGKIVAKTKNVLTETKPVIDTLVSGSTEFSDSLINATSEADTLKDKFNEIGNSIQTSIKDNLRDSITGAQSFGQAMTNVLNRVRDKIIDAQIDKAIGGFGESFGSAASGGKRSGLGGFLGGVLGGLFANGGRPPVGKASVVGERGPELFVPKVAGTIIPNSKLGGGDNVTNMVTVNVDASGSSVSGNNADAQALGAVIGAAVQAQLVKEKRAGGLLSR